MRMTKTPLALVIGLIVGPAHAAEQSLDEAIAASRAAFEAYIESSSTPGVSVAVVLEDDLVWAEGFGLADVEQGVPVTPKTLFRAWSVSKPLTAAAVGLLHERGRLDLDAPVQRYVPGFPDKGKPITPRQLGGHRAGIPHYGPGDLANYTPYGSVLEALDKFKDRPLLFDPGTDFEYSTFGYTLLGAVIESAAETPYLDFMQAEVFGPLGMRDTRPDRYREVIPGRTRFYEVSETGDLTNAPFTDNSDLWPGGGFLSTPTDLVLFGAGLLRGDLMKPSTVDLLFTPMGIVEEFGMGYALGWYVLEPDEAGGGRILMHSGGHYGGAALLVIWEEPLVILAIMANATMTDAVFRDLFMLREQTSRAFMAVRSGRESGTGAPP